MVSAMILLFGAQIQMSAQYKGGPDHRRPGMEMHEVRRPGKPMNGKTIRQSDISRLQEFYWKKYRVRISRRQAERILLEEMRGRGPYDFYKTPPPPPKVKKPQPKPQPKPQAKPQQKPQPKPERQNPPRK